MHSKTWIVLTYYDMIKITAHEFCKLFN